MIELYVITVCIKAYGLYKAPIQVHLNMVSMCAIMLNANIISDR